MCQGALIVRVLQGIIERHQEIVNCAKKIRIVLVHVKTLAEPAQIILFLTLVALYYKIANAKQDLPETMAVHVQHVMIILTKQILDQKRVRHVQITLRALQAVHLYQTACVMLAFLDQMEVPVLNAKLERTKILSEAVRVSRVMPLKHLLLLPQANLHVFA